MFYGEVFKALNKAKIKYVVAGGPPLTIYDPIFCGYLELIVAPEERSLREVKIILNKLNYRLKGSLEKFGFFYHKKDPLLSVTIFPRQGGEFDNFYKRSQFIRLSGVRIPLVSKRYLKRWQNINKAVLTEQLRHGLKSTTTQRMYWLEQACEFVRSLKKMKIIKR